MRLKLKTESKDYVLQPNVITEHTDLSTFLLIIEDMISTPASRIKSLVIGYPPKQIKNQTANSVKSLQALGIKNGDTIRLRKDSISEIPEATPNLKKEQSKTPTRKRSSKDEDYMPSSPKIKPKGAPTPTRQSIMRQQLSNFQGTGTAARHEVPSDNSCLFYCIDFALNEGVILKERARNLRTLVSNKVLTNSTGLENFLGELTLGQSIDEYCAFIQSDTSWGGATEIAILAQHYRICIMAIDIKTLRIDTYGHNFKTRTSYILYDGIHYDPLFMNYDGMKKAVFNLEQEDPTNEFVSLAEELKAARQYTDASEMKLMCGNCGTRFRTNPDAVDHAKRTGHTNFQEC